MPPPDFKHAALVEMTHTGESTLLLTTDPQLDRMVLLHAARQISAQELAVAKRVVKVDNAAAARLGQGRLRDPQAAVGAVMAAAESAGGDRAVFRSASDRWKAGATATASIPQRGCRAASPIFAALDVEPDLLVLSGDLVDAGTVPEYRRLRVMLDEAARSGLPDAGQPRPAGGRCARYSPTMTTSVHAKAACFTIAMCAVCE